VEAEAEMRCQDLSAEVAEEAVTKTENLRAPEEHLEMEETRRPAAEEGWLLETVQYYLKTTYSEKQNSVSAEFRNDLT
jgi:hypothetical protein